MSRVKKEKDDDEEKATRSEGGCRKGNTETDVYTCVSARGLSQAGRIGDTSADATVPRAIRCDATARECHGTRRVHSRSVQGGRRVCVRCSQASERSESGRQAGGRARWLRQSPHMLPGCRDHEESTNKPRVRPRSIYCARREGEVIPRIRSFSSRRGFSVRLARNPDRRALTFA